MLLQTFWLSGLLLSTVCLMLQTLFYIQIACSRRLELMILTQLSLARLFNVILEYLMINVSLATPMILEGVFALYLQTDATLIVWLFIFTKNIYDKYITVYKSKMNFALLSAIVWIATIPLGILFPVFLTIDCNNRSRYYFKMFYELYTIMKFITLAVSLIMLGKVCAVELKRSNKGLLRVFSFFLMISIPTLQVLLSDACSFGFGDQEVSTMFSVVNSYQVIVFTIIFVVLVRNVRKASHSEKGKLSEKVSFDVI